MHKLSTAPNQSRQRRHGLGLALHRVAEGNSGAGQGTTKINSGSGHSPSLIMFYVYVLRSIKDPDEIYVGYTTNLRERFSLHQQGLVRSTKPYRPWKLIYYEAYISKADAKRREEYLKTAKGKRALKLMLQDTLKI